MNQRRETTHFFTRVTGENLSMIVQIKLSIRFEYFVVTIRSDRNYFVKYF